MMMMVDEIFHLLFFLTEQMYGLISIKQNREYYNLFLADQKTFPLLVLQLTYWFLQAINILFSGKSYGKLLNKFSKVFAFNGFCKILIHPQLHISFTITLKSIGA